MAIEFDRDIVLNPELSAVLEIELDEPGCREKIDIDDDAVFQVPSNRSNVDPNNAKCDGDLEAAGIKVSRDLFAYSLAKSASSPPPW